MRRFKIKYTGTYDVAGFWVVIDTTTGERASKRVHRTSTDARNEAEKLERKAA